MNKYARKRIFNRLNSAVKRDTVSSSNVKELPPKEFDQAEKIEALKSLMEAVRTEVYVIDSENWVDSLKETLKGKGLKDLLYAPGTGTGKAIEEQWGSNRYDLPELIPYNKKIEQFKSRLFKVDASITTAKAAIADVGSIILCPDENEPRTMSLVPPVHIAVLNKENIYNNMSELILCEGWSEVTPTNVLLISGPSKTADIELELAYGVHGPKELILLIV